MRERSVGAAKHLVASKGAQLSCLLKSVLTVATTPTKSLQVPPLSAVLYITLGKHRTPEVDCDDE